MRSFSRLMLRQHPIFRRYSLLLAVVALLGASLLSMVNIPRALACPVCIPPDKVTLTGSGISGTATIADTSLLGVLGAGTFMGFEHPVPVAKPIHMGDGYELVRYYQNSGVPASFWTLGFDHMRYYPGVSGQPGYIYYEGFVSSEARNYARELDLPPGGRWFQLTAAEDNTLQQLLAAAHADPPVRDAVLGPSASSVPASGAQPPAIVRVLSSVPPPVIALLTLLLVLVAAVGYRVLSVRRHRAPFAPLEHVGD
ncbi:MAG TPA: hypothetical protein VFU63_08685 [Ktedonobacterales bacterium]|nr:hypothetical protein [Ktedonobacterales bacterium]